MKRRNLVFYFTFFCGVIRSTATNQRREVELACFAPPDWPTGSDLATTACSDVFTGLVGELLRLDSRFTVFVNPAVSTFEDHMLNSVPTRDLVLISSEVELLQLDINAIAFQAASGESIRTWGSSSTYIPAGALNMDLLSVFLSSPECSLDNNEFGGDSRRVLLEMMIDLAAVESQKGRILLPRGDGDRFLDSDMTTWDLSQSPDSVRCLAWLRSLSDGRALLIPPVVNSLVNRIKRAGLGTRHDDGGLRSFEQVDDESMLATLHPDIILSSSDAQLAREGSMSRSLMEMYAAFPQVFPRLRDFHQYLTSDERKSLRLDYFDLLNRGLSQGSNACEPATPSHHWSGHGHSVPSVYFAGEEVFAASLKAYFACVSAFAKFLASSDISHCIVTGESLADPDTSGVIESRDGEVQPRGVETQSVKRAVGKHRGNPEARFSHSTSSAVHDEGYETDEHQGHGESLLDKSSYPFFSRSEKVDVDLFDSGPGVEFGVSSTANLALSMYSPKLIVSAQCLLRVAVLGKGSFCRLTHASIPVSNVDPRRTRLYIDIEAVVFMFQTFGSLRQPDGVKTVASEIISRLMNGPIKSLGGQLPPLLTGTELPTEYHYGTLSTLHNTQRTSNDDPIEPEQETLSFSAESLHNSLFPSASGSEFNSQGRAPFIVSAFTGPVTEDAVNQGSVPQSQNQAQHLPRFGSIFRVDDFDLLVANARGYSSFSTTPINHVRILHPSLQVTNPDLASGVPSLGLQAAKYDRIVQVSQDPIAFQVVDLKEDLRDDLAGNSEEPGSEGKARSSQSSSAGDALSVHGVSIATSLVRHVIVSGFLHLKYVIRLQMPGCLLPSVIAIELRYTPESNPVSGQLREVSVTDVLAQLTQSNVFYSSIYDASDRKGVFEFRDSDGTWSMLERLMKDFYLSVDLDEASGNLVWQIPTRWNRLHPEPSRATMGGEATSIPKFMQVEFTRELPLRCVAHSPEVHVQRLIDAFILCEDLHMCNAIDSVVELIKHDLDIMGPDSDTLHPGSTSASVTSLADPHRQFDDPHRQFDDPHRQFDDPRRLLAEILGGAFLIRTGLYAKIDKLLFQGFPWSSLRSVVEAPGMSSKIAILKKRAEEMFAASPERALAFDPASGWVKRQVVLQQWPRVKMEDSLVWSPRKWFFWQEWFPLWMRRVVKLDPIRELLPNDIETDLPGPNEWKYYLTEYASNANECTGWVSRLTLVTSIGEGLQALNRERVVVPSLVKELRELVTAQFRAPSSYTCVNHILRLLPMITEASLRSSVPGRLGFLQVYRAWISLDRILTMKRTSTTKKSSTSVITRDAIQELIDAAKLVDVWPEEQEKYTRLQANHQSHTMQELITSFASPVGSPNFADKVVRLLGNEWSSSLLSAEEAQELKATLGAFLQMLELLAIGGTRHTTLPMIQTPLARAITALDVHDRFSALCAGIRLELDQNHPNAIQVAPALNQLLLNPLRTLTDSGAEPVAEAALTPFQKFHRSELLVRQIDAVADNEFTTRLTTDHPRQVESATPGAIELLNIWRDSLTKYHVCADPLVYRSSAVHLVPDALDMLIFDYPKRVSDFARLAIQCNLQGLFAQYAESMPAFRAYAKIMPEQALQLQRDELHVAIENSLPNVVIAHDIDVEWLLMVVAPHNAPAAAPVATVAAVPTVPV